MDNPRYQAMTRDATRRPALWRLLAGFVTAAAALALWVASLVWLRGAVIGSGPVDAAADLMTPGSDTPGRALLYLAAVAGLGPGTCLAAFLWQRRGPRSLIGPGPRTLRHATMATAAALGLIGLLSLLTLPLSDPLLQNRPLALWLAWLPLGAAALILQTGGEEVFFRGYLQSQLTARFQNALIPILVPSAIFGALHYVPTLPLFAALTYVLVATLFGILAADLTLRTGSIGAAWGFHLANNAFGVLVVATDGSIVGLALWRTGPEFGPVALASPLASVRIAVLLATWALIRRILRV